MTGMEIVVDFMVIRCGYAARLLTSRGRPRAAVLAAAKDNDVSVVLVDAQDFQGHRERYGGLPPSYSTGTFEADNRSATYGCVVIDSRAEYAEPWGFVADLMKLRHCAFFDWKALYEHTYDRRTRTLYLKFDTESG